jgi:hypothetical protein
MTGYQAPPLDGIWATAPYLHNGSVPHPRPPARLHEAPPPDSSAPLDRLRPLRPGECRLEVRDLLLRPERPHRPQARYYYDTARFGLGNGGHRFGDKLDDDERSDLIEYLKTL